MKIKHLAIVAIVALVATACGNKKTEQSQESVQEQTHLSDKYAEYTLTTKIDHLSDNEKEMLKLLFEAADIMDGLFWQENYGDKDELMALIGDNEVYHIGASIKDLGKKWLAFTLMHDIKKEDLINKIQGK